MMKNDDYKLLRGFDNRQTDERTNRRTDICDFRVAFTTDKKVLELPKNHFKGLKKSCRFSICLGEVGSPNIWKIPEVFCRYFLKASPIGSRYKENF